MDFQNPTPTLYDTMFKKINIWFYTENKLPSGISSFVYVKNFMQRATPAHANAIFVKQVKFNFYTLKYEINIMRF